MSADMSEGVRAKIDRLRILLGDDFPRTVDQDPPTVVPEGKDTDSEDGGVLLDPSKNALASMPAQKPPPKRGQTANQLEIFCPLVAISKFPYKFLPRKDMQRVHDRFFQGSKFWARTWDIYFVWPQRELCSNAILLLTQDQVGSFLKEMAQELQLDIAMPKDAFDIGLSLQFSAHPELRPRFLGRSADPGTFRTLKSNVPLEQEVVNMARTEFGKVKPPSEATLAHWKASLVTAFDLNKGGLYDLSTAKAERKALRLKGWISDLKRAEQLLGLRATAPPEPEEPAQGASWAELQEYHKAIAPPGPQGPIDPEQPPTSEFDKNPVFVCIDVECYEKDLSKVTEIGIASLDTKDLIDANKPHGKEQRGRAPGQNGINWQEHIHARHFRIQEHQHLRNGQFVQDAADKFLFSQGAGSEFVALADAPRMVASCFRPPFCALGPAAEEARRNLVLVGHDVGHDVQHLRKIGFDARGAAGLGRTLDTADLFRGLTGQREPVALGAILDGFGMDPWSLHNAGNDAVYTLWALLGIVVRSAADREPV